MQLQLQQGMALGERDPLAAIGIALDIQFSFNMPDIFPELPDNS
jgi:hypothetical protein